MLTIIYINPQVDKINESQGNKIILNNFVNGYI